MQVKSRVVGLFVCASLLCSVPAKAGPVLNSIIADQGSGGSQIHDESREQVIGPPNGSGGNLNTLFDGSGNFIPGAIVYGYADITNENGNPINPTTGMYIVWSETMTSYDATNHVVSFGATDASSPYSLASLTGLNSTQLGSSGALFAVYENANPGGIGSLNTLANDFGPSHPGSNTVAQAIGIISGSGNTFDFAGGLVNSTDFFQATINTATNAIYHWTTNLTQLTNTPMQQGNSLGDFYAGLSVTGSAPGLGTDIVHATQQGINQSTFAVNNYQIMLSQNAYSSVGNSTNGFVGGLPSNANIQDGMNPYFGFVTPEPVSLAMWGVFGSLFVCRGVVKRRRVA